MGELQHEAFQFTFNGFLKVAFQGSRVVPDAAGGAAPPCAVRAQRLQASAITTRPRRGDKELPAHRALGGDARLAPTFPLKIGEHTHLA